MVTIFKDIKDTMKPNRINVSTALKRIKEGKSDSILEKIRAEEDKKVRAKLKETLPSVLFSADSVIEIEKARKNGSTFKTCRADECVVKHSGFAIFDVDDIENPEKYRDSLKTIQYIYAAWVSPSKNGVNFLIRIPTDINLHLEYYSSFIEEFPALKLDTTSRNIARVKYESSDKDLWINDEAKTWNKILPKEKKLEPMKKTSKPIISDLKKVGLALSKIANSHDGEKMKVLLQISHLFGGWAANGDIDENTAVNLLRSEITKKDIDDEEKAFKAIDDAFDHGRLSPLGMYKERDILQMKVGSDKLYYTLEEKRDELDYFYENGYGTGAKLGWLTSHSYVSFVPGGTTFIYGSPAAGKSILSFEVLVDFAVNYGWKTAIMSPEEGSVGEIFGTLISTFIGKQIFGEHKMSKEELARGIEFVEHYFYVIEPIEASITLDDFFAQVEGIERHYDVKLHATFIDPATYIKHEMSGQFNREDLALNESLKKNLIKAKLTDRHHFISIHLRDMARMTNGNGQVYFPIGTPRDLMSGQAWFRNGFNMISLWRTIDVKHKPLIDDDGMPYEENQVEVWIQKFKPRGSGKLGKFDLFFDWKKNQFYEMIAGKRRYSPKTVSISGDEFETPPEAEEPVMQPNLEFGNTEEAPF